MNIIKQFEDPEFVRKVYHWTADDEWNPNDKWFWGLGDDGELYFRCTRFSSFCWITIKDINVGEYFTLKTMRRIVKEFGHLVIFT